MALDDSNLSRLRREVEKGSREGGIAGGVVSIGGRDGPHGEVAFGWRAVRPCREVMTCDAVFDLASLTKVVATTTAVMQLEENGRLDLGKKISAYLPELALVMKSVRVRDLLTHYSGLPPELEPSADWQDYDGAIRAVCNIRTSIPRRSRYTYSDINFILLGELVRRIARMPFDEYCQRHVFLPLEMRDTCFVPSVVMRTRIVPTVLRGRAILRGEVHDECAWRMGGIAGHAGLFATARDLGNFCSALLGGRTGRSHKILRDETVARMSRRQSPLTADRARGFGWDLADKRVNPTIPLLYHGTYGHVGFTGTSIWIDPTWKVWVLVLTSRLHPDGRGRIEPLRKRVAEFVRRVYGTRGAGGLA